MSESEAYTEGYRAGKQAAWKRLHHEDNPYPDGEDWLEWDRGFTDGRADDADQAAEYRAEARREERCLEKLNKQE
jgi:hypothetical protein